MRYRLSCKYLEGALFIMPPAINACYLRNALLAPYTEGGLPVAEIIAARNRIRNALENDIPCSCTGCPGLEYANWPDDNEKHLISTALTIITDSPCNSHCVYCCRGNCIPYESELLLLIFKHIVDNEYISPEAVINCSSGEPTIRKDFKEYSRLFLEKTKSKLLIPSNGMVFSNVVFGLLQTGRAYMCVSIDACSKETYFKIKKRNTFFAVIENIKKYKIAGDVVLKYIVLPENSHEDPECFFNLSDKLQINKVAIVVDHSRLPIAPAELDKLAAMLVMAEQRRFLVVDDSRYGGTDLIPNGFTLPSYIHYDVPLLGLVVRERQAYHRAGAETANHYQVAAWPALLTDDAAFAFELHFLLTGTLLTPEERIVQGKRVATFPSRFHYALDAYCKTRETSAAWLAGQTDYAQFWRACLTILGRKPAESELHNTDTYTLSLRQTMDVFFTSETFQSMLRQAERGGNLRKAARESVILLYALILLRFPESEEEVQKGMRYFSLSQLALTLLASPEFEKMQENLRATRARAHSETELASLREGHKENYPPWLQELLHDDKELTLFQLWMRRIRKPAFASVIKGKEAPCAPAPAKVHTVLCFGTGDMAANLIPALDKKHVHIAAFLDDRPERQGTEFMGAPVVGLAAIREFAYDYVLVCARPYERLKNRLLDFGVPEEAIVSADIEALMHGKVEGREHLSTYIKTCVARSPVLHGLLDECKMADSGWVAAANASFSHMLRFA